jgi:EAL domain-containing protein (putative c-di-GMP-specific phosphodiesterase class I)
MNDAQPRRTSPATLRAVVRQGEFRQALASGQLLLHYMPIMSLGSGRMLGAEALLRWMHPQAGLLLPDSFLPAIAHSPVMRATTKWVVDRACADLRHWPDRTVAVNISARDVTDPEVVSEVSAALEAHGVEPPRLTLELTEHSVVSDLAQAVRNMEALRRLGVRLSLDDFGTGYSSMLYLRELPLTEVKIDRTFIQHVITRPQDAAIVESVVRLATAVGMTVIAEGVEDAEQVAHLHALGCQAGQGFLWGRPVAAPEIDLPTLDRWQPPPETTPHPTGNQRLVPHGAAAELVQQLIDGGASLHTIAAALNRAGFKTPRGARWSVSSAADAVRSIPDRPRER